MSFIHYTDVQLTRPGNLARAFGKVVQMDSEAQQRIIDCVEACRYFGNPAALPAVIDALNDLLNEIAGRKRLEMDSPTVVQLRAALDCLDIRPPGDSEVN